MVLPGIESGPSYQNIRGSVPRFVSTSLPIISYLLLRRITFRVVWHRFQELKPGPEEGYVMFRQLEEGVWLLPVLQGTAPEI